MIPWKTLSRQKKLEQGRFLTVEMHTVQLPNGQIIADWPWLVTPDFVNVVVETAEGRFLCFRQTKYAVEGTSLAPVGGYLEPGEEPLAAARRELREETGYEACEWISLGDFPVDANRGNGRAYLFLARQARCVTQAQAGDLEEQELLCLSRSELEQALAHGDFKTLPWVTAIALALRRLGERGSTGAVNHPNHED
jgi:ADP-ribose pyrophosphatase